jgi:integrase/recombinase XerD
MNVLKNENNFDGINKSIQVLFDTPLEQYPPVLQEWIYLKSLEYNKIKEGEINLKINQIDINKEIELFLQSFNSKSTVRVYRCCINSYVKYCKENNLILLTSTPKQIDDYLIDLNRKSKSQSNINIKGKVLSSLFSFLQRRYSDIISVNPCKGNRIVKEVKNKYTDRSFPSITDISIMDNNLKGFSKLVLILLVEHGFRITGLYNLEIDIKNKTFQTITKGKVLTGKLTDKSFDCLKLSFDERLIKDIKKPFTSTLAESTLIKYFMKGQEKLFKENKINQVFTPHKFRSYFASRLYSQTKDIYLCKKVLGHTKITSTETYLQGLNAL